MPSGVIESRWMRRQMLGWYGRRRRDLPWRAAPGERGDAYEVWVAEIMLQQTRVGAVVRYYERFLRRFPDLGALARAKEETVLGAWSGLGYYRRARQLHAAARIVVRRHQGRVPMEEAALRALPGIGAYTANAIRSMAGGAGVAAVDGNGLRIAHRLTGGRVRTLGEAQRAWSRWVAPRRAGDFNQAVMDLGATVCLPRTPHCGGCPLRRRCPSRGADLAPLRARAETQTVEVHYALCEKKGRVWLRQRPPDAAQMPGMWELPRAARVRTRAWAVVRHTITRSRITAHVHRRKEPEGAGQWMSCAQARVAPLTGLARKILMRVQSAAAAAAAGSSAGR
ncbi:MAG: A/G-specific adenine glycosylase [Terriglobales bacterium]